MEKLFLVKGLDGAFRAHSDGDYELSKRIKPGIPVEVKLSNNRILGHHRKFFILLGLAYDNMPEQYNEIYPNKEAFRKGMLLMAGHIEIQKFADGKETIAAGSMSFLDLKQREFEQVYSSIIDIVLKYFVLEMDLQKQIVDLI